MPGIQPCPCDCCNVCIKCCAGILNPLPKRLKMTVVGSDNLTFNLDYVNGSCGGDGLGCQWTGTFHSSACGADITITVECFGNNAGRWNFNLFCPPTGAYSQTGSDPPSSCSPFLITFSGPGHIAISSGGCGSCGGGDPSPGWIFTMTKP